MNEQQLRIVNTILGGMTYSPAKHGYLETVATVDATIKFLEEFKHGLLHDGAETARAREIMKRELIKRYKRLPSRSTCLHGNAEELLAFIIEHPKAYGRLIEFHAKLKEYFPNRHVSLELAKDPECGTDHGVIVNVDVVDDPLESWDAEYERFEEEYYLDRLDANVSIMPQF